MLERKRALTQQRLAAAPTVTKRFLRSLNSREPQFGTAQWGRWLRTGDEEKNNAKTICSAQHPPSSPLPPPTAWMIYNSALLCAILISEAKNCSRPALHCLVTHTAVQKLRVAHSFLHRTALQPAWWNNLLESSKDVTSANYSWFWGLLPTKSHSGVTNLL